jgi:hypothetical protein
MKYESPITYMYHSKDMVNVKVFEKWVKLQGQGLKVKNMVPIERSYHKKHTYEIRKPYYLLFKRYMYGQCSSF